MSTLKEQIGSILACLFEILVGILLLINPVEFTTGIIIAFGISMLLAGLITVIKYFRTNTLEAAAGQLLAKGLGFLLVGIFCTFQSQWFVATFPVLTILYGIILLVTALVRVQYTVDMIRLKRKRWFLMAISAVLSIICGIIILSRPFATTVVLWTFTGISLIVEAVLDIIAILFGSRQDKEVKE